jgi:7-carboxy-7-deazaguanine synthase
MTLRIHSIFSSIQGESTFQGLPFTFIRLAGCNLKCTWCDTSQVRSYESGNSMSLEQIMTHIRTLSLRHICITGGEPLMQDTVYDLMEKLISDGFCVTLETNGSLHVGDVPEAVHRIVDVKCPSSGMKASTRLDNLTLLTASDEVKFVIVDRTDYLYAREVVSCHLIRFAGKILFSPVANLCDATDLASWILLDKLRVRVHIQLHKILNLP